MSSENQLPGLVFDSIMNQIIHNDHQSSIINGNDMERAILRHPLFSSIVSEMDSKTDILKPNYKGASKIKKHTKRYPRYIFTEDGLSILQNFIEFINHRFPTKRSLERAFPLFSKYIAQIYTKPEYKNDSPIVSLKEVEIDTLKPLFHTTNSFEIFEMKNTGTPYGPAYFSIDTIFSPEFIKDFHPERGALRVIRYKWIPSTNFDLSSEYPFVDVQTKHTPKILDATRVKFIPPEQIEKYLGENGMILELPTIDKSKDILTAYGRTWRPFVVKYLESYGFDGILFNKKEIVIFKPERWIVFDTIEQGDMLYTALIESLKKTNKNKTLDIAEKYDIDPKTLQILRRRNIETSTVNNQ